MSSLKLKHSGGNSMSIEAPATNPASNLALKLPATVGSANQFLKNSGTAGTLGWSSVIEDSSGRVLIGTTTEGHTSGDNLTIAATDGEACGITLRSDTDEGGRIFFSDGTSGADEYRGVVGYDHGSNYLYLSTDGSERMRIDSSGNVGIGETAPLGKFHVKSADSGGTAASYADELVLEGSGDSGMTILSGTTGDSSVNFGDSGNNTVGRFVYNHNTNHMHFNVNDAERMRIVSSGELCIGRTDATVNSANFGTSIGGGGLYVSRDVTGASHPFAAYGNQGVAYIMGDGDLLNTNNSYGSVSDETLKQDIVDAASQWDDIKNIRVRKFRFKDNPTGVLQIGVVAQEIEKVSAGLVSEKYLDGKTDSGEKVKSVKYSVLHMKAVKALQEAMATIETLEAKVAALEAG